MKKSVLITIVALIIVLAAGITIYAATRPVNDDSDNPVARQSYTNGEYSQTLLKDAASSVDSSLKPIYDAALETAQSASPAADTTARRVVSKGGGITLSEGSSITMLSGQASIAVAAGTVSDVTAGSAVKSGDMAANHRYIVCTGGSASVSVSGRSVFICSGSAKVTAGEVAALPFKDIKTSDWYYNSVAYMVELGLMSGTTKTTFSPSATISLAQAICLAADIYQLKNEGGITLKPDADVWYMSYVEYAVSNGVIEGAYAGKTTAQYNAPVSRGEFIHILYKALPADSYTVISSVADGSVSDVPSGSEYADDIYAFYRAGILTGGDGGFGPDMTVSRAQAAAIMSSMLDSTLRQASVKK